MSFEFRLPNITAPTAEGQVAQISSYFVQLIEQLNFALNSIDSMASKGGDTSNQSGGTSSGNAETNAQNTFSEIKSLIIKSADIVNAYYEEFKKRFDGLYVAESEFGTFEEKTKQDIIANSTSIESLYANIQTIISDIENVENTIIDVNAHIKSGLLYYDVDGTPVYGLEIGQRTEVDGVETFNKYARFTSEKLSFYDKNDNEVAYISDRKLYISNVEVTASYKIGGLVDSVLSDLSVVTKYVR